MAKTTTPKVKVDKKDKKAAKAAKKEDKKAKSQAKVAAKIEKRKEKAAAKAPVCYLSHVRRFPTICISAQSPGQS